ncbi:uncharacterized protein K441DRAFT_739184 [Cenococcum geophilum 1.58]|uniref:uncharacterized protein n=1 Tax=Cenococcum geophilum 1.58 TaxID=794803 RepID=UPI00358E8804|nr:hypothetical protein K441DRAFT_739184 [Cenococcum geophilum 1.58]
MESATRDPLVDLERHRLRLEENVAKLRKSLQHWQTWELEYEGLKEEIQRFKGQPTTEDIVNIGKYFGGDLVNEKEIKELLGFGKGIQRNASQVIDLISRRLDYVQQNTQTVQKQLDAAEKKLRAALTLLEPDLDDEEGLPLTDIQEELDEEGNVISSTLSHPSKSAPGIINTLRKTGVAEFEETQATDRKPSRQPGLQEAKGIISVTESNKTVKLDGKHSAHLKASSSSSSSTKTRSLLFPQETEALSSGTEQGAAKSTKPDGLASSGFNNDLAAFTFNRGNRVIEIDKNDNEVASYPVIPADESPEDAALRREMLQYGLSEVGSVVAEIDLDAGGEFSGSDEDYESEYVATDDEEEDEYGRITRRVLTDDYKNEMLELEKRLNARMLENLGPRPESNPLTEYAEDVRRLVVQKQPAGLDNKSVPKLDDKKTVRFAEELDISPAPTAHNTNTQHTKVTPVPTPPLNEVIVERSAPSDEYHSAPSVQSKTTRVSRFKSSREAPASSRATHSSPAAGTTHELRSAFSDPNHHGRGSKVPRYTPEGPPGKTLASSIVERPVTEDRVSPPDDTGLDPMIFNQEVAVEYHRIRNRLIQKQGGFMPSEAESEEPLVEEINGKTKKVSRFRAARLKHLDS